MTYRMLEILPRDNSHNSQPVPRDPGGRKQQDGAPVTHSSFVQGTSQLFPFPLQAPARTEPTSPPCTSSMPILPPRAEVDTTGRTTHPLPSALPVLLLLKLQPLLFFSFPG